MAYDDTQYQLEVARALQMTSEERILECQEGILYECGLAIDL